MDGDLERVSSADLTTPPAIIYTITRSHVHLSTIASIYPCIQAGHVIDWQIFQGGPYLHNNRNRAVRGFLEDPRAPEILMFVDSDMRFGPQALLNVLHACTPESPVVGGMYRNPGPYVEGEDTQPLLPVAYLYGQGENDQEGYIQLAGIIWNDAGPDDDAPPECKVPFLKVDGIGTGFMAIHRSLLEHMPSVYPEPTPWFDNVVLGTPSLSAGEDLGFCHRVRVDLGFPIILCRAAKVGHQKELLI